MRRGLRAADWTARSSPSGRTTSSQDATRWVWVEQQMGIWVVQRGKGAVQRRKEAADNSCRTGPIRAEMHWPSGQQILSWGASQSGRTTSLQATTRWMGLRDMWLFSARTHYVLGHLLSAALHLVLHCTVLYCR
jgi:hypothetical protein